MAEAKATVIPNFITAATPKALRRLMFKVNTRLGAWHKFDIQFVNNRWVAWYYEDLTKSLDMKDIVDDPTKAADEVVE